MATATVRTGCRPYKGIKRQGELPSMMDGGAREKRLTLASFRSSTRLAPRCRQAPIARLPLLGMFPLRTRTRLLQHIAETDRLPSYASLLALDNALQEIACWNRQTEQKCSPNVFREQAITGGLTLTLELSQICLEFVYRTWPMRPGSHHFVHQLASTTATRNRR